MTTTGTIKEVGPFVAVTGYDDTLDLWEALLAHYLSRRPPAVAAWGRFYPETNLGDVFSVSGLFTERLNQAPPDLLGLAATRKAWEAHQAEIKRLIAGKFLHDAYPDNARFWRTATRQLAVDLSLSASLPHKTAVVLDAVRSSVSSFGIGGTSITETLNDAFGTVADAAEEVVDTGGTIIKRGAEGVGGIVKSIGSGAKDIVKSGVVGVGDAVIKPLVDAIGKPLLIGAAVLGGLLIVPRLLDGGKRDG